MQLKRNSTHGTANQMLEAFRNKVDDLEAQDSLGASVDIHAAEDEWDETENEFRTDYLPDLRASVERELRELDTIDSWSWSELDDSLVLTVVVGDKVEEFDIPFSDIYQGVSTDVDYIMKAVNHTVDSCTNITASSDIVTLVDFLSEHDQAYEDAQDAFGVDDLMDLSYEELYSWIADHDQLFEDLCEYDPL